MAATLYQYEAWTIAKNIAPKIIEFYKNPENNKRFEDWFLKTYGVTYSEHKERESMK